MPIIQLRDRSPSLPVLELECRAGLVTDLLATAQDRGGRLHLDLAEPHRELASRFTAWIKQRRLPWIYVCGAMAAPVLGVLAKRLDLRIGGALLVAPTDWRRENETVSLPLAPLAFPALLVRAGAGRQIAQATARRLAVAWGIDEASVIDRLESSSPVDDPVLRGLMLRRATSLRRAGVSFSRRLH